MKYKYSELSMGGIIMYRPRKTKSVNETLLVVCLLIIALMLQVLFKVYLGERLEHLYLGIFFAIGACCYVIALMRTRNISYIYLIMSLTCVSLTYLLYPYDPSMSAIFAYLGLASIITLVTMISRKKIRNRHNDLLEYAACSVADDTDGFTQRPYAIGEVHYSKEEIKGFAKYLLRRSIAFPYFERDRVVVVIPKSILLHILYVKRSYKGEMFISFDYEGRISVNIAKKDYEKYTDKFAFDQICRNLGELFKELFELYQSGEEIKFIEKLNII